MNKHTVNKNTLATSLAEAIGLPTSLTHNLIEQTLSLIAQNVKLDGKVQIPKFGIFVKKNKKARKGRDIGANKEVIIAEREVMVFHPADQLKVKINEINQ